MKLNVLEKHENYVRAIMGNERMFVVLLCSSLYLGSQSCQAQLVEADVYTRAEAISRGVASNKMILLIMSDTNDCSGCRTLEFSSLPSRTIPLSNFLRESFIYY